MKKILNGFLIIFGAIMFLIFIWLRFVRERLPKILPFLNLSGIGLTLLIYICCIYFFILYIYLKKNRTENLFISNVIKNIYLPLISLDNFLKSFKLIKELNYKFLLFLAQKNFWYYNNGLLFFYLFEIFPRIILVTAFVIDTYYFHYLANIYKVLIIGIFIFIGKYIKYSFKALKEHLITENAELISIGMLYEYGINIVDDTPPEDPDEADYIPDYLPIPLDKFVEYQVGLKLENEEIFPYRVSTTDEGFLIIKKKYGDISYELHDKIIISNDKFIRELLEISYISGYLDLNSSHENMKKLKIVIFLNYFLLWLYIIIISIPFSKIDITTLLSIVEILRICLEKEAFL